MPTIEPTVGPTTEPAIKPTVESLPPTAINTMTQAATLLTRSRMLNLPATPMYSSSSEIISMIDLILPVNTNRNSPGGIRYTRNPGFELISRVDFTIPSSMEECD